MPPDSPAVSACLRPRLVEPVLLGDLATCLDLDVPSGHAALRVSGITSSSTGVQPGDLYAALPGTRTHGARFGAEVVRAGAVAVLTDLPGRELLQSVKVPVLVTDSPRALLGTAAAYVYGNPSSAVTVVGVTGTSGKTTTTRLLAAGVTAAGRTSAVIGTLGTRIGNRNVATALTTPEAPDVHALLAVMREEGVQLCAMEVSSHALVMGRVDGVRFSVAAFTNFGRDHLDFHGTVEAYFAAKASLFRPERAECAVLNADDESVARLARTVSIPCSTFSATGGSATWRAVDVRSTGTGSSFTVEGPGSVRVPVSLRLPGPFNVANALCALACAGATGVEEAELHAIARGVADVSAVPGRLEPVDRGQDFAVLVDYAHKPEALSAAISAVRSVTSGRVILVLGAGGDRDPGKRPLMGSIAAELADVVVVTDDNPRSEDPALIRSAILSGIRTASSTATVLEVAPREAAIAAAVEQAAPGDAVLIVGKGHETGQQIGDRVLPFDDREVVGAALGELAAGWVP